MLRSAGGTVVKPPSDGGLVVTVVLLKVGDGELGSAKVGDKIGDDAEFVVGARGAAVEFVLVVVGAGATLGAEFMVGARGEEVEVVLVVVVGAEAALGADGRGAELGTVLGESEALLDVPWPNLDGDMDGVMEGTSEFITHRTTALAVPKAKETKSAVVPLAELVSLHSSTATLFTGSRNKRFSKEDICSTATKSLPLAMTPGS